MHNDNKSLRLRHNIVLVGLLVIFVLSAISTGLYLSRYLATKVEEYHTVSIVLIVQIVSAAIAFVVYRIKGRKGKRLVASVVNVVLIALTVYYVVMFFDTEYTQVGGYIRFVFIKRMFGNGDVFAIVVMSIFVVCGIVRCLPPFYRV